MSWISIRDLTEIVVFLLNNNTISGPVNVVSPHPVTNLEFTKTLADVLHKPAKIPAPPFMLRLMFGEMADEMLLASSRVQPEKLLTSGYTFKDPHLPATLEFCVEGGG